MAHPAHLQSAAFFSGSDRSATARQKRNQDRAQPVARCCPRSWLWRDAVAGEIAGRPIIARKPTGPSASRLAGFVLRPIIGPIARQIGPDQPHDSHRRRTVC